jgi:hypothetical protein
MSSRWPITISLPGIPLSPNARRRSHWSTQARDTALYRDQVAWLSRAGYHGPPLESARVLITLIHRTAARFDPDGAVGVTKCLLDGLCLRAGGALLVDDQAVHLSVDQATGPRRGCLIQVWPIEELAP